MSDKKNKTVSNGLKLVGETLFLPGSSLLVDGNIKSGLLHAGAGIAARTLLGGPFFLLVAANSFSLSLTGENLVTNLLSPKDARTSNLGKRVKAEIAEGVPLHEIQESVLEDVEDLYLEAKANSPQDEQKAS